MAKYELTSAIQDKFEASKLDFSNGPIMGFRKVDGVRAGRIHPHFHGRSLDGFRNTAINERFAGPEYHGLDGELTIDGILTSIALERFIEAGQLVVEDPTSSLCSLTTGLTNRNKVAKGETALPDNVIWNLFDYLTEATMHLPYLSRYEFLVDYVARIKPKHVHVLPFVWIHNADEALAWIEDCMVKGYEGAIFRNPKAKYKSGRAKAAQGDFWRYKPVTDKDAIVVGLEPAMANNNAATTNSRGRTERSGHKANKVAKAQVGVMLAYDPARDSVIRVPAGCMKVPFREKAWADKSLVLGHPIKYTSLDHGEKDEPRQARYKEHRSWADLEQLTPYAKERVAFFLAHYAAQEAA